MKKLLSLTAVALHLSISPSVNAQDFPAVEEFILLAELTPPAIRPLPTPPAIAALAPLPTAQTKIRPAVRLRSLAKPIEPIMALSSTLVSKPTKARQADPLGELVNALMMESLPLDDLLKPQAAHPVADLAKPRTADPLGELLKPLAARPVADLAKPLAARPMADLAKPRTADPLGDLADVLDAPLVLEPVPPASIDSLDDLAKTRE
ncbi:MAG: hypothetical protein NTZ64_05095 [Polaromonas sp.]|nr:hypothetical protein [Polaromonas sp.]